MKIVCISDTHGRHRKLNIPEGDILVHAGDFTSVDSGSDLIDLDEWFEELPHPYKILIAGNHDWCFQKRPKMSRLSVKAAIYLQDEAYTIGGVKFYGSPWQPRFCDWAFNLDRGGPLLKEKWSRIPDDTDILITHGPPADQGDLNSMGVRMGCQDLAEAIKRVQPKVHIFGHNHEGYGVTEKHGTIYVNASTCTARYSPTNTPIVIDLEKIMS
jgi:Icc-related predicted phosphoesterase